MKKLILPLLCAAALSPFAGAQSNSGVLVVDIGAVFNQYTSANEAMKTLQSVAEDINKDTQNLLNEANAIQKQGQEIESNATNPALTAEAREQYQKAMIDKRRELEAKVKDYNSFRESADAMFKQRQQALVSEQIRQIVLAAQEIAKAKKATIVLNGYGINTVLYADDSLNITNDVVTLLNSRAPAAAGATSAAGSILNPAKPATPAAANGTAKPATGPFSGNTTAKPPAK